MATVKTMTSDIDIYRTANLLIKQRGALEAEINSETRWEGEALG